MQNLLASVTPEYIFSCLAIFILAYTVNLLYISVFYHRALAHGAIELKPIVQKFVVATGSWITGLDPKGWICMHRMHHQYSDTESDPHSPVHVGVFGVLLAQLRSYERVLKALHKKNPKYTEVVRDLDFDIHWLNRKKLWLLPYITQVGVSILLGYYFGVLFGTAYYFGIISHPIQGWMVNAFAHSYGYSNYDCHDNSKNNVLIALLVAGEGLQNNHHYKPKGASFAHKWWELDPGYGLVLLSRILGIAKMPKEPQNSLTPQTS